MTMRRPLVSLLTALVQATSTIRPTHCANTSAFVVTAGGGIGVSYSSGTTTALSNNNSENSNNHNMRVLLDAAYPGTAVERMTAARDRVRQLDQENKWNDGSSWETLRRRILWAGGLKDLPNNRPGQGYTGHSFNDWNHVDLTCMLPQMSDNENDGSVKGIALGNRLGAGIRIASIEELGPGGSWSTCALGCNKDPPQDVAHVQFRARIAFKLVWVPNAHFDRFVLVDDDGKLLATGQPSTGLPPLRERQGNYEIVRGSKYAKEADRLASGAAAE